MCCNAVQERASHHGIVVCGAKIQELCLFRLPAHVRKAFVGDTNANHPWNDSSTEKLTKLAPGTRFRTLGFLRQLKWALLAFDPNRLVEHFGFSNGRRIQCCPAPRDFQGQSGVVNNTSITAVTAQVVIGSHKNAVDRAGIHTKCTEHALCVINGEPVQPESFSNSTLFLLNVNTVHRAGLSTLFARDTGGEIKTVKPPVTRLHFEWHFGVLIDLRECPPVIRLAHGQNRHNESPKNRCDGQPDISKPSQHEGSSRKKNSRRVPQNQR